MNPPLIHPPTQQHMTRRLALVWRYRAKKPSEYIADGLISSGGRHMPLRRTSPGARTLKCLVHVRSWESWVRLLKG